MAECRPSLAELRMEVLAVDTFFLTDTEAARFGCPEKKLQRKSVMCGIPSVSPSPPLLLHVGIFLFVEVFVRVIILRIRVDLIGVERVTDHTSYSGGGSLLQLDKGGW
ncbi:hypothetical protein F5148DRAFT_1368249 [Russula earlei]|uniref:Uncharacterized protein n=1 Tax=Russula earlei TaxID=71964 RepID=A0ACC0U891_9AGAM|nr:hypothetical protein F5148DRAFT_1368249 [Russula earlei]